MRKRTVSVITALVLLLGIFSGLAAAESEEILIGSAAELQETALTLIEGDSEGKYYKLTADIDFSGFSYVWGNGTDSVPIGTDQNPFRGTFDGNGHVIKNYTVTSNSGGLGSNGLFGAAGDGAVIKNLGMTNTKVCITNGIMKTAAMIGQAFGKITIENCFLRDTAYQRSISGNEWTGGFVSWADFGSNIIFKNCYATGTSKEITSFMLRGDFFGLLENTSTITLENCYSDTNQFAPNPGAGYSVTLKNCYANSEGYYNGWNNFNTWEWLGQKVTPSELKELAPTLGSAYSNDVLGNMNHGYPMLTWELGEKMQAGKAQITSSNPTDGQEGVDPVNTEINVTFNRYLKTETITKSNIQIEPETEYTIAPISGEFTDTITLLIPDAGLGKSYTVSFLPEMKTVYGDSVADDAKITFTTSDKYPEQTLKETNPENGAAAVPVTLGEITLKYSTNIRFDELSDKCVSITPAVPFELVKGNAENILVIKLKENLKNNKTYEISVSGIPSVYGNLSGQETIFFATAKGFINLTPCSDFEDNMALRNFADASGGKSLSLVSDQSLYGRENRVLKINPAWGDQPVLFKADLDSGTTYYMSAWLKSDADQNVAFAFYKEGDRWDTKKTALETGKWTFVGFDFRLESGEKIEHISIRPQSVSGLSIDEWTLYDTSYASQTALGIKSSTLQNGQTEVTPIGLTADLEFTAPVKLGSLADGIRTKPKNYVKNVTFDANDMYRCHVEFDRMETGKTYTLDLSGVQSMRDGSAPAEKISFTTIQAGEQDASLISSEPTNGQTGVLKQNGAIKLVFDQPVDPGTISGITLSPDADAKAEIRDGNYYQVWLAMDSAKIKRGTSYTVTIPESVKTLNGYQVKAEAVRFTTLTDQELLAMINQGLGNPSQTKTACENVYPELDHPLNTYDYLVQNLPEQLDVFAQKLSESKQFTKVSEIEDAINQNALAILLDQVSDTEILSEIIGGENGILPEGIKTIFADSLENANRKNVAALALQKKSESYQSLVEQLSVKVINEAFSIKSGADAVREILTLAKAAFTGENDISALLQKIDQNKNAEKIYAAMQKTTASTPKAIKDELQKAYDQYKDSNTTGGGTGGGGSGGNSSGGSSSKPMIATNVTIKNEEQKEQLFPDVPEDFWAKASIETLSKKGIVKGFEDGNFQPNKNVTRAEFAKMAVDAGNLFNQNAQSAFSDVPGDHWSYPYVSSAYQNGLVSGISENVFGKDQLITREDMAVILYRMISGENAENGTFTFADDGDISGYAKNAVYALYEKGIISGVGDGRFDPKACATRAQAAVVFDKYLKLYSGQ